MLEPTLNTLLSDLRELVQTARTQAGYIFQNAFRVL